MAQKNKWLISFFLAAATAFIMQWQGSVLKSFVTPLGIVDLELANTKVLFEQIVNLWDISAVRINIWLDFLFIPAYTFFFITSLGVISDKHQNSFMKSAGQKLTALAYMAMALDVAENIFLLFSISGTYSDLSLQLTALTAGTKFTCVGIILFYMIFSGPIILFGKKQAE